MLRNISFPFLDFFVIVQLRSTASRHLVRLFANNSVKNYQPNGLKLNTRRRAITLRLRI